MEGNFVAGADPELMLVTPTGALTSAIPLIKGTKEDPLPVAGGAVQHDNVMAEFNVNPSENSGDFVATMREVLGGLADMVSPNLLITRAYAEYPESELSNPVARKFGCEPDFNAWPNDRGRIKRNVFDTTLAGAPFRSAGGHFHVGYKAETKTMLSDGFGKLAVIRMMDIFMGIPSVLIDPDPTSPERRSLYGKAGAHRPKDYGVEYRALGNFWVASPTLVEFMYRMADLSVSAVMDGNDQAIIEDVPPDKVQAIINGSDVSQAHEVVVNVLEAYLSDEDMDLIMAGPNPHNDLYENWSL